MIKFLSKLTAIVAICIAAGIAMAEEVKDYHLEAEVPARFFMSDKFKLKPSDAPKGIYIVAISGWSSTYPGVAGIIKDKFRANGFVVTDKIEEADLGITFLTTGAPQLEDVESNVSHMNKEFVATQVGAAVLSGGLSLISTGMQLMGNAKGLANLAGVVSKGPLKLTGKGRIDSDKTLYEGRISSKFAADEINSTVHAKLFEAVLDGYMKEFTAQDEPVAVSSPAQPVSN